jgi:hypothetical protein
MRYPARRTHGARWRYATEAASLRTVSTRSGAVNMARGACARLRASAARRYVRLPRRGAMSHAEGER